MDVVSNVGYSLLASIIKTGISSLNFSSIILWIVFVIVFSS